MICFIRRKMMMEKWMKRTKKRMKNPLQRHRKEARVARRPTREDLLPLLVECLDLLLIAAAIILSSYSRW